MLYTPYSSEQPIFEVTAITMRTDPIYRNHQMTPFTDHQELPRLFHEAILYERLVAQGIRVHDVAFPQAGGALLCALQVDPAFDGQVTDALLLAMGQLPGHENGGRCGPGRRHPRSRYLLYAMAIRVCPDRDVITVGGTRGWPFDPSADPIPGALPDTESTRFSSVAGRGHRRHQTADPSRENTRGLRTGLAGTLGEVRLSDYLES